MRADCNPTQLPFLSPDTFCSRISLSQRPAGRTTCAGVTSISLAHGCTVLGRSAVLTEVSVTQSVSIKSCRAARVK